MPDRSHLSPEMIGLILSIAPPDQWVTVERATMKILTSNSNSVAAICAASRLGYTLDEIWVLWSSAAPPESLPTPPNPRWPEAPPLAQGRIETIRLLYQEKKLL